MKDISLHILDITENSITARSGEINISIEESLSKDNLKITIADNGIGIPGEMLNKVTDPFYTSRSTRKVGMGLSLLKQKAEQAGGIFEINSESGKGTEVSATFKLSHIDRPPLGNISSVISLLTIANPSICFTYTHKTDAGFFDFNSRKILDIFKEVSIGFKVRNSIEEFISENLKEIKAIQ
jgi:DNA mismatch repair ATPase MutL